jgi:hypothetical protein
MDKLKEKRGSSALAGATLKMFESPPLQLQNEAKINQSFLTQIHPMKGMANPKSVNLPFPSSIMSKTSPPFLSPPDQHPHASGNANCISKCFLLMHSYSLLLFFCFASSNCNRLSQPTGSAGNGAANSAEQQILSTKGLRMYIIYLTYPLNYISSFN